MLYFICPDCAFETQDSSKRSCDYCKSELLLQCPHCRKPLDREKTIFCGHCGEKLKISICPIQ